MKLKVAYLFARYPVPSQTFCDTEMRALEALGWDLEIHVVSPPLTAFRHGRGTRPAAAPVFYAPHGRVLDRLEARARREGRWPTALIAEHETRFGPRHVPARRARHALFFADFCRRHGVGHVHVHFASDAVHTALFLESFGGPPFSFTAHGQDFMLDLGNDDLLREMAARARFVVAVSDWSRDLLRAKCPASAHRIVRVHNGLPDLRDQARHEAAPADPAAPPRILSVGRLIEFKGFHVLIAACAELARRGLAFRCEIIGEGPWREELERLVREHGLADRVFLPGLRDQAAVLAAMAGCDVFALACVVDRDGACDVLPTVILEAMAAGKPVVATALAGVPELVLDGETGRLVSPGDPLALADALAGFLRDPDRRAACGHAGRLRLERHFRAADSARALGELFRAHCPDTTSPLHQPVPAATTSAPPRLLFLLADGPPDQAADAGPLPGELRRLHGRLAEDASALLRVVALRPPARRLDPDDLAAGRLPELDPWWLETVDTFLPDGMVLEGEWRERADVAHRLEAGREHSPGSLSTEEFLLQARRALWLFATFWERGSSPAATAPPPRHVHAEGRGALLCACLLRRLAGGNATASFSLEHGKLPPELPGSALRRLVGEFAGGRVANDAPLVRALGEWPVELAAGDDGADDGFVERLLGWVGYGAARPHGANVWDD